MKTMLRSVSGKDLSFEYDPFVDVLILDGTKYSGELFRAFGNTLQAFQIGAKVEIVKREDGALTLQRI